MGRAIRLIEAAQQLLMIQHSPGLLKPISSLASSSASLSGIITSKYSKDQEQRVLSSFAASPSAAFPGQHSLHDLSAHAPSVRQRSSTARTLSSSATSRMSSLSTGDTSSPGAPDVVTFPSKEAGGIILAAVERSEESKESEEYYKDVRASVFDNHYQSDNRRTGKKQMDKLIKGPFVLDYYLDKHDDPLIVDTDGQDKAEKLQGRNERGFYRRRPQKKDKTGKASKKK